MNTEPNVGPSMDIFAPDALPETTGETSVDYNLEGPVIDKTVGENVTGDLLVDKSAAADKNATEDNQPKVIKSTDLEINQERRIETVEKGNSEPEESGSNLENVEAENSNLGSENATCPSSNEMVDTNVENSDSNQEKPVSILENIQAEHSVPNVVESENCNVVRESLVSQAEKSDSVFKSSNVPAESTDIDPPDSLEAENDETPEALDGRDPVASKESLNAENVSVTRTEESDDARITESSSAVEAKDTAMGAKKSSPSIEEDSGKVPGDDFVTADCAKTSASVPESTDAKTTDSKVSDVNLDIPEKDSRVEKNVVEPENTEFVQITQDKHDDQIESQSMEAEDPFGGDNLNSENVDQMETENLTGGDIEFQKLGDQADNLQDVVNAKDNNLQEKLKDDQILDDSGDRRSDKVEAGNLEESQKESVEQNEDPERSQDKLDLSEFIVVDKTNKNDSKLLEDRKKDKTPSSIVDPAGASEESDGDGKKNSSKEVVASMEAEDVHSDVHSDVLPGQDDELCIIPDSMKVIIPEKSTEKPGSDSKESRRTEKGEEEEDESSKNTEGKQKSTKSQRKVSSDLKDDLKNTDEKDDASDEAKKGDAESESAQNETSTLTDVIDVDEESKNSEIEEITTKEKCKQCDEEKACKIKVKVGTECFNVCSKDCRNAFKAANNKATDIPSDGVNSKREKRCANCLLIVEASDERNLSWETMEFCNEECLGKFQTKYGSYCRNCNGTVQAVSLGKYCVRFGYDVRQFCCSTCLEEFKKGLKVCSYCQKDISSGTEGFLAPVGDKGQFKDFCTQDCMEKYSRMSSTEPPISEKKACSVCQEEKIVHCEVKIDGGGPAAICGDPCFAAFKFVNKVDPDQCSTCKKFFELPNKKSFVVFYENEAHMFCNKTCLNVFIITNRKIVPCNWCKVKKYNFDMIKKELKSGQVMMMCSLNCLTLYQVSINAVSARRINCDFCKEFSQAQYHLTMSDATIRNFCSYNCVMNFQGQYTKSPITIPTGDDPVPTGMPKRTVPQRTAVAASQKPNEMQNKKTMPVISSVTSLASIGNGQTSPTGQQNAVNSVGAGTNVAVQSQPPQVIYKQQVISRPSSPVKVHNRMTQCKPMMHTKGVSVRPHPCTKSTQTDEAQQIIVPVPVPIYVPYPMHMYSMPFPVPFPFPLPIPVPIFIPTTRNSAKGIFKDIKRIQEKIPADPFEAELLMMAEMVATEKKTAESDSDSGDDNRDDEGDVQANSNSDGFSPDGVDSSNTFGDDMLQMALKMATGELDEPAVDLEAALTPNTITATQAPPQPESAIDNDVQPERLITATRGRKRIVPYKPRSTPSKRGRRVSGTNDMPLMPPPEPQPPPQPRIMEPIEKPDANMALKYTFGVNAWRQWVIAKNTDLEKQNTPTRKIKLFKTELLQLTADELNYSLCLFVKEVRKPNGAEYAPDTIYYLCLGIQQYLFENNRIDNIFTDSYYEKFTDCLNEVAKKFSVLYNDAQYIVTRVEEEHLWECKQLGAHSPHVLLSTLMFFNTKHFNLVTVEEHMQLSFSHIMKHWKRNPAAQPAAIAGKVPGSRNVLLRFYPPQSALEANSRKKKVYEQQENEENPLRCPVKLYEFYLSKCPESVKTRNDVFYLLPERSCVPDSPVWYSTSPLAKEHLVKMLYRVKMVKEINVALLTS